MDMLLKLEDILILLLSHFKNKNSETFSVKLSPVNNERDTSKYIILKKITSIFKLIKLKMHIIIYIY